MSEAHSELTALTPAPPSLITAIGLLPVLPVYFMMPKFAIGQTVQWATIPTGGYGRIIGVVYATGVSVVATGYHYLIVLDPDDPFILDCTADWAFEADLQLVAKERA